MTTTLQQVKPKILLPDEGESFQFFDLLFTRKMSGDPTNSGWVMSEITARMGTGAPLHSHPWSETFYILEGQVEVQVGSYKALAIPGTFMYVPENVAHSFRGCAPTNRLLEIIPASAESFYREGGEKIPTLPPDPEVLQVLFDKYSVRLF